MLLGVWMYFTVRLQVLYKELIGDGKQDDLVEVRDITLLHALRPCRQACKDTAGCVTSAASTKLQEACVPDVGISTARDKS